MNIGNILQSIAICQQKKISISFWQLFAFSRPKITPKQMILYFFLHFGTTAFPSDDMEGLEVATKAGSRSWGFLSSARESVSSKPQALRQPFCRGENFASGIIFLSFPD